MGKQPGPQEEKSVVLQLIHTARLQRTRAAALLAEIGLFPGQDQVLQCLLMLSDPQRRLKPSAERGRTVSNHFEHLLSPADGEMQDSELNSLLQGQSIYIENCTDVRISVRQLEVEKVVELGLVALGLREHQLTAKAPAVDAAGAPIEQTEGVRTR